MKTFTVSDSGPAFRNKFEEECKKMGIRTEHSSAYNPSLGGRKFEAFVEERIAYESVAII